MLPFVQLCETDNGRSLTDFVNERSHAQRDADQKETHEEEHHSGHDNDDAGPTCHRATVAFLGGGFGRSAVLDGRQTAAGGQADGHVGHLRQSRRRTTASARRRSTAGPASVVGSGRLRTATSFDVHRVRRGRRQDGRLAGVERAPVAVRRARLGQQVPASRRGRFGGGLTLEAFAPRCRHCRGRRRRKGLEAFQFPTGQLENELGSWSGAEGRLPAVVHHGSIEGMIRRRSLKPSRHGAGPPMRRIQAARASRSRRRSQWGLLRTGGIDGRVATDRRKTHQQLHLGPEAGAADPQRRSLSCVTLFCRVVGGGTPTRPTSHRRHYGDAPIRRSSNSLSRPITLAVRKVETTDDLRNRSPSTVALAFATTPVITSLGRLITLCQLPVERAPDWPVRDSSENKDRPQWGGHHWPLAQHYHHLFLDCRANKLKAGQPTPPTAIPLPLESTGRT